LDPALQRPGRVDFQALITHCTKEQMESLFYNFYPDATRVQVDNFLNRITELGLDLKLSPAILQGHFLVHKNSPESATRDAEGILALIPKPKKE